MPQYNDTLATMVARVLQAKPNAQQSEVVRQINGRIRQAINSRIYWSDLVATRILAFPDPYSTGTVSTTYNSNVVTGASTSWPTNDAVNTTSNTAVTDIGYQQITPASMTGINVDTLLYCDSSGSAEVVPVVQTTPTTFWAPFTKTHSTSFTITSSSLAGLQLDFGTNWPIFTVMAVTSSTSLIMDQPFGGPALSGSSYQILKMYVTIDPNLKVILDCVDQQVGRQLEIYVPQQKVNLTDPQRSQNNSDPLALVQRSPSPAGSMMYEVWPAPASSRQLWVFCGLQWPELKMQNDRPPWFMDPNLFVTGAIADALRIKNIRSVMDQDPWFNPDLAMQYEQMYRIQLQEIVNSDESKAQLAFTHDWQNILAAGGANYWKQHDPDLSNWSL